MNHYKLPIIVSHVKLPIIMSHTLKYPFMNDVLCKKIGLIFQ